MPVPPLPLYPLPEPAWDEIARRAACSLGQAGQLLELAGDYGQAIEWVDLLVKNPAGIITWMRSILEVGGLPQQEIDRVVDVINYHQLVTRLLEVLRWRQLRACQLGYPAAKLVPSQAASAIQQAEVEFAHRWCP